MFFVVDQVASDENVLFFVREYKKEVAFASFKEMLIDLIVTTASAFDCPQYRGIICLLLLAINERFLRGLVNDF